MPVRQTITVDAAMKLASLQETVTVSGSSPTVDVENTKVGARLSQEILTAVPTSRTIFGSTTVLPGMTMGRQDPGGLNAATSTGMVAHGASNYNLNYYGVTADTPQNYGSMYYMDFGSAEEVSVDTAAMGAEVGGGGGANINVIPKSGGNTVKGDVDLQHHRQGLLGSLHRQQRHRRPARAGHHRSDAAQAERLQRRRFGGPFIKDRLWWFGSFRNYTHGRSDAGYTIVNPDGSLTNPFDSNLRNYTASGKYQVNKNNQLSAFWTYNRKFQPHRGAGVAQPLPDQHAAPGIAEEPDQRQLDVGDGPEHVPRSLVDLLPHALAEHLGRRVQRAAGEPAVPVDVQRHAPASTSTVPSRPASASATPTGTRPTSA